MLKNIIASSNIHVRTAIASRVLYKQFMGINLSVMVVRGELPTY